MTVPTAAYTATIELSGDDDSGILRGKVKTRCGRKVIGVSLLRYDQNGKGPSFSFLADKKIMTIAEGNL